MSRPVSATLKRAVNAPETSEAFIVLLTIDHPDLGAPIRVSSDAVDTVSRGLTFVAFPFDLSLPDDSDERPPRAKLRIDNIDRQVVEAVRSIASPASVLIEVVLASDPDTVEAALAGFELRNVRYDALTVEGDLLVEQFTAERYPARVFSPADFPGIF